MKKVFFDFLLRVVFGSLGLYVCNNLLNIIGVDIYLGINIINLLTIGILGISGFGLVLAISLFSLL